MKVVNKIKLMISFCLLFLSIASYSQSKVKRDSIKIANFCASIDVLVESKKDIFNYEEGLFVTYFLRDSSYISIVYGSMIKKPILNLDSVFSKGMLVTKLGAEIFGQRKNMTFYREVAIGDVYVLYDNVQLSRKKVFDSILDSFQLSKCK